MVLTVLADFFPILQNPEFFGNVLFINITIFHTLNRRYQAIHQGTIYPFFHFQTPFHKQKPHEFQAKKPVFMRF